MAEKSASPIVWEDPPADRRGIARAQHLDPFAAALREHPGRWARYPIQLTDKSTANTATRINSGLAVAFAPGGTFEAVTRLVDDARVLYVRYVGEAEAGAA